jgi:hypothetical protein
MTYVLDYTKWKRLFEQEESGLSNVKAVIGIAGATGHPTTNQNALNSLISGGAGVKILGTTKIGEDQAIVKNDITVKGTQNWKVANKTVKSNNYIKIGNRLLDGDATTGPVAIDITSDELSKNQIEAAGNGIYALGRILPIKYKLNSMPSAKLVIGLNQPNPDALVVNVDTQFQDILGKFKNAAIYTFVGSGAVIPGKDYHKDNVDQARSILAKKNIDLNTYTSMYATPSINNEKLENLSNVGAFDLTDLVQTISGKKFTRYNDELQKYLDTYVDNYFEKFANAFVERFKAFITSKANGANPAVFKDLYGYMDSWKAARIAQKEEYRTEIHKLFNRIFGAGSYIGSTTKPTATAGSEVVKGKVGKL